MLTYEMQRRNRRLGYAIDSALSGVKLIIVSCDKEKNYWDTTEMPFVDTIKGEAENILLALMVLERKLDALAPIYERIVSGGVTQDE